jgi:hypothetical protein
MTDYSDFYGGRFLKTEDVQKPFKGVVERVTGEKMQDGRLRAVVYFEGREKGVVLNATRHKFIVGLAKSKDSTDWVGLTVGVRTTDFGGKDVGCIVFEAPPKSAQKKTEEAKEALNDEIPW